MKIWVGITFVFLSGLLIYIASAMSFASGESNLFLCDSPWWLVPSYTLLPTWFLIKGAQTVSKVFIRGFLLGAAEWLAMIPVSIIFGGRILTETVAEGSNTNAELAVATIGAGLISFITGRIGAGLISFITGSFAIRWLWYVCSVNYPLIVIIGLSRATSLASPAFSAATTTSSTLL